MQRTEFLELWKGHEEILAAGTVLPCKCLGIRCNGWRLVVTEAIPHFEEMGYKDEVGCWAGVDGPPRAEDPCKRQGKWA